MGFVQFEGGSYVKKSRPNSFWTETDRAVTLDTNKRKRTDFEVGSTYRSTQGDKHSNLSVDHKVPYDAIARVLVQMLNLVHASADHSATKVANEVRLFKSRFMSILYHDPGSGMAWDNRNQEMDGRLRLAVLEKALLDHYSEQDGSIAEVCEAAHSLLLALNSSADNLRDGFARVNSAIQQYFDPHIVETGDGHDQMTPRSKGMAQSAYAEEIGVCLTPSGNSYLTSDFCTARSLGSLTPRSRTMIDGMKNKTLKSKKWSKSGPVTKKRRIGT